MKYSELPGREHHVDSEMNPISNRHQPFQIDRGRHSRTNVWRCLRQWKPLGLRQSPELWAIAIGIASSDQGPSKGTRLQSCQQPFFPQLPKLHCWHLTLGLRTCNCFDSQFLSCRANGREHSLISASGGLANLTAEPMQGLARCSLCPSARPCPHDPSPVCDVPGCAKL